MPNLSALVPNLQKVLDAVQQLAPLAGFIGGPAVANIAAIGVAAVKVIENVLERGGNLKDALSTHDEAKLRAMLAELQEVNDELAKQIADS